MVLRLIPNSFVCKKPCLLLGLLSELASFCFIADPSVFPDSYFQTRIPFEMFPVTNDAAVDALLNIISSRTT